MDKIVISGLQYYAYHGVFPAEQELGQRYQVDIECFLDLSEAGKTDSLDKTVNYAEVVEEISRIMGQSPPVKLIETLAEQICNELLRNFPLLQSVKCKVIKPNPPIHGHYEHVAVEIMRNRNYGV